MVCREQSELARGCSGALPRTRVEQIDERGAVLRLGSPRPADESFAGAREVGLRPMGRSDDRQFVRADQRRHRSQRARDQPLRLGASTQAAETVGEQAGNRSDPPHLARQERVLDRALVAIALDERRVVEQLRQHEPQANQMRLNARRIQTGSRVFGLGKPAASRVERSGLRAQQSAVDEHNRSIERHHDFVCQTQRFFRGPAGEIEIADDACRVGIVAVRAHGERGVLHRRGIVGSETIARERIAGTSGDEVERGLRVVHVLSRRGRRRRIQRSGAANDFAGFRGFSAPCVRQREAGMRRNANRPVRYRFDRFEARQPPAQRRVAVAALQILAAERTAKVGDRFAAAVAHGIGVGPLVHVDRAARPAARAERRAELLLQLDPAQLGLFAAAQRAFVRDCRLVRCQPRHRVIGGDLVVGQRRRGLTRCPGMVRQCREMLPAVRQRLEFAQNSAVHAA